MKKVLTILITIMIALVSCQKEETFPNNNNNNSNNNNNNNGQSSEITINQIKGVWVSTTDDIYFLSLNPNMHYSLCLQYKLKVFVGSGTYSLNGNKLTLYNDYNNTTETLTIRIKNDGQMICDGNMFQFGQTSSAPINVLFVLDKTSEPFSPSKVGSNYHWLPYPTNNGDFYEQFDYDTYNTASWNTYKEVLGTWQLYRTKHYYYVYRAPHTYTIRLDNLEIMYFDFEGPNGKQGIPLP